MKNFIGKDSNLRHWASTIPGFKLEAFAFRDQNGFEDTNCRTFGISWKSNQEYLRLYGPLLSYSPNRFFFLDYYSDELFLSRGRQKGNRRISIDSNLDQTLLLADLKQKRICRIAFLGSSQRIEETAWTSDSTFIAVGTLYNGRSFQPFVFVFDLKGRQTFHYWVKNEANFRTQKYRSLKWSRMDVNPSELYNLKR